MLNLTLIAFIYKDQKHWILAEGHKQVNLSSKKGDF